MFSQKSVVTWHRARTLRERASALDVQDVAQSPNNHLSRRLSIWKSEPAFQSHALLQRRLQIDGLDESRFAFLLSRQGERALLGCNHAEKWIDEVEEALNEAEPTGHEVSDDVAADANSYTFLNLVLPLIHRARKRLRNAIEEIRHASNTLAFNPDTIESILTADIADRVLPILAKTLVLELNIFRLQGLLKGGSPEARFRDFTSRLRDGKIRRAIFAEYPVVARQVVAALDAWQKVSLEFLQHVSQDYELIRSTFSSSGEIGVVSGLSNGAGDSHRGGRSVRIVSFSSGLQVVYKPRPLSTDVHFQALIGFLNNAGLEPKMRMLKVLDRQTHGWVEFVEGHPCDSLAEVQSFFERHGCLLAVLYILRATDFHMENIIAAGEHPVAIDLEGLFEAKVPRPHSDTFWEVASRPLRDSVLSVSLLPGRTGTEEGIDISGLGGAPGQVCPQELPQWDHAETDVMRLVRKRLTLESSGNRTSLNGEEVRSVDFTAQIVRGFTTAYRLIMSTRHQLLTPNGPVRAFAEDDVRVILRSTFTYCRLLQESFHPDLLRNALDRDRLFDRLWTDIESRPALEQVVPSERIDLEGGDVPIFTTRPSTHDLFDSRGTRVRGFFTQTGIEAVTDRLQQCCEEDLSKQVWLIRAALGTSVAVDSIDRSSPQKLLRPTTLVKTNDLIAAARAIGDHLGRLSYMNADAASWLGIALMSPKRAVIAPAGPSLYDGTAGIALFLAYLGAITGVAKYTALARAAVRTLGMQMAARELGPTDLGGFTGFGGIIHALTQLRVLWGDESLLNEAAKAANRIAGLVNEDTNLDVLLGAAGCIPPLIQLAEYSGSPHLVKTAVQCGDRLLETAVEQKCGAAWQSPAAGDAALTGFSHGAAGFAWALLKLAQFTGLTRFRTAAADALAYERSAFSPERRNWPDLRSDDVDGKDPVPRFVTAWCHGAPGIGLARLDTLDYMDDAATRRDIETALETTMREGLDAGHCLCHGVLGNVDLLLEASIPLSKPELRTKAQQAICATLQDIKSNGWKCGTPCGVEAPGLMTGIAGIGYQFLRGVEPERVPSVLTLSRAPKT